MQGWRLTLDLFKALAMQLAHRVVLLSEKVETSIQGVGDVQVILIQLVLPICFLVFQRDLHLLYRLDKSLCLLLHLILFTAMVYTQ